MSPVVWQDGSDLPDRTGMVSMGPCCRCFAFCRNSSSTRLDRPQASSLRGVERVLFTLVS